MTMRHYLIFAALLIGATFVGCADSTPVDKDTSNPVEDTNEKQRVEDEKGKKLVNEASEAAK